VRLFGRIGQALIEAKQDGRDPFAAIEAVMSWDAFAESVTEAQKLAQPEDFDFLHRVGESYAMLRRYAPEFLAVLKLRAAPAAKDVLDAIEVLRGMNSDNARKVPADAPTEFIKPRWQKLVMTDTGIDRRYYELCALSEIKNALAVALRELGRIERTLFILDWLQSVELRRRVHAGLNKGEARNALARAVFFNRLGEIRDRSFEQQRYRASGLNLVTAAIVLWNTVYLERATNALHGHGQAIEDALLQYLSPLGWEHINLTGDDLWRSSAKIGAGKFRPLRPLQPS
jgi:hypothetical protein